MKANDIRAKNDDELGQLLLDMRRKQFNMRMQTGTGQPARASDIRGARKDVARIKTIIEERRQGDAA
jgi:large subunit ribosomal protein L29